MQVRLLDSISLYLELTCSRKAEGVAGGPGLFDIAGLVDAKNTVHKVLRLAPIERGLIGADHVQDIGPRQSKI